MAFAEKLKNLRKERNITQEEFAEKLSVSRQAVSKWESGSGYPEVEKLVQMAKLFDVSLDDLLLDERELEERPAPAAGSGGRIIIASHDKKDIVSCTAVRSSKILCPMPDEPKYVLNGVDKVTFWGEHTVTLGWYASEWTVQREIEAIEEAIGRGESRYALQYAAKVKYVGFFGSPRIVEE